MKTRTIVSFVASAAFAFAFVGEAHAKGACVYVKNETFQCTDQVSSLGACQNKAPGHAGEFYSGTTCKRIGHGVTWGIASPPPPPAKADFTQASMSVPTQMPSIPSPLAKKSGKSHRF
jgi:hypothetical protein